MTDFFSADHHHGHGNIIKYSHRTNFCDKREKTIINRNNDEEIKNLKISDKSVEIMSRSIILAHNARVKTYDTLYHVGDFAFKSGTASGNGTKTKFEEWDAQLNGRKVYFLGNHDKNNGTKTILRAGVVESSGQRFFVTHRPSDMNPDYEVNLVAHVHDHWPIKTVKVDYSGNLVYLVNVGVDVWNFYPVTIPEIIDRIKKYKDKNMIPPAVSMAEIWAER